MKKRIFLFAAIFLAGGWTAGAKQIATPSARGASPHKSVARAGARTTIRHVIVVSVDGLLPESYTAPDSHGLKVPTLREIFAHGAASPGVRTVMPAVTYPAHTTMVTGVAPRTHGIIANAVFDPLGNKDGEWFWYAEEIRVPTLWDLARARGLRTAMIGWPVTMGARGDYVVPEFWRGSGTDGARLLRSISTPGLFAAVEKRVPTFTDGLTPPTMKDRSLTDIAVTLIESAKPNLLLLHLPQVDHWQHENGPWSPEALAAIENADQQISRLIEAAKKAGTWSRTALLVVSDHGFTRQAHTLRPGVLLREKGLITLDEKTQKKIVEWKAQVLSSSGSAYIYLKDSDDMETRRAVEEIFLPMAGRPGSGISRVFRAEEIAALGGDPAAFLALVAAEGYGFAGGATGESTSIPPTPGLHGFPPDMPEMNSSLLIYGPGLAPGKIENARLIDIAPTISKFLGLRLEKAEGAPLAVPLAPTIP